MTNNRIDGLCHQQSWNIPSSQLYEGDWQFL